MNIDNTIQIIENLTHEIEHLRRRNEILSAKVQTMDLFSRALGASPGYGGAECMGLDVVHAARSLVERLKQELKEPTPADQPGGQLNEVPVGIDPRPLDHNPNSF